MKIARIGLVCTLSLLAAACASHAKDSKTPEAPADKPAKAGAIPPLNPSEVYRPAKEKKAKPEKPKADRVTLELPASRLGEAIRSIGEQTGGNVVLMSGVEDRVLTNVEIKRQPVHDAATHIASLGGLAIEDNPNYTFLFPGGYEQLLNLTMAGRLDARYTEIKTDAVFGSRLPLYSVFMWMGYALHTSIVADNSVGDARCGELALRQVPLEAAIEAILKSARVAVVQCESTPDYIFLSAAANTNPKSALLEAASNADKQTAILAKKVTLALPYPLHTGQRLELPMQPSQLGDVLPALSEQLGIRVVAEKGLEKFPVNPFYVRDVSVQTAMDLLIRQWLVPNYGYQVLDDRIVIRTR